MAKVVYLAYAGEDDTDQKKTKTTTSIIKMMHLTYPLSHSDDSSCIDGRLNVCRRVIGSDVTFK